MVVEAQTIDEIITQVFHELLARDFDISTSRSKRHGPTSEVIGNLLVLANPRARISRSETRGKPFSALGEVLWYFSGTNKLDFIEYYISPYCEDAEPNESGEMIIHGGYGPRLMSFRETINQFQSTIDRLKQKPNTRKAVIQLFDAEDLLGNHKDIPCTCTLQFLVRRNRLHLFTNMRSNDAVKGLAHDIFCFTFLQELIACELNIELGTYYHSVTSLHMYEEQKDQAKVYLSEGLQGTKICMPKMPTTSPVLSMSKLLEVENEIRKGAAINYTKLELDDYWLDLIRLLEVFKHKGDKIKLIRIKNSMSSKIFDDYIQKRILTAS
ncbi:thymidylate synthase [Marinoscillum sp. 108]|uniref:thymidylate synthase n=1 Tax=Marinoscillum sp. 108 TaxID=2653151 RepID=UPI0012F07829|nr:thymidylate synthase [Marinoscillum sp. 108]VXD18951.1 Thymidylate synthase [Marinoscillum sp. 108]